MTNSGGDVLARGGVSAQFSTPNVSQDKWDEAVGGDNSFEERMRKKALAEGITEEQYEAQVAEASRLASEIEAADKAEREAAQAKIKIRAIADRVIVRRVEVAEKVGRLFVADESKEKPYEGDVVAVGPGRFIEGKYQPTSIAVGERVVFGKYSGAEVRIGFETLLVLREEDIFLVKEQGD
ncbi:10 kDa chaperonin [uncultured archaeon]|nr:10 kDa chaperonin [uncultured archaeon]